MNGFPRPSFVLGSRWLRGSAPVWWVATAAVSTSCSDRRAQVIAAPPEPALEVARERMLPLEDRDQAPLFGPDGTIIVGTSRFASSGRRGPRSHWSQNGQIHPVAAIGTAAHPQILAVAWDAYPHPDGAEVSGDGAWLIAGDPDGRDPAFIPTGIRFANPSASDDGPMVELSPDRHAIVAIERAEAREELVVRSVPAGTERARIALAGELSGRACWVDAHRIAWRDSPTTLATFDLATRTTARTAAPGGEIAACAAGGGDAALVTATRVAIVDLARGRTRGTIGLGPAAATPTEDAGERVPHDRFALRAGGCDVAMVRGGTLSVLHCETLGRVTWYRTTRVHAFAADVHPPSRLAFSPDARRLALVGDSLVVLETSVAPQLPPALPAMAELPHGFAAVTGRSGSYDGWGYAQLATPTGLAPLPAKIVHARRDGDDLADVVTIAMELDAFSSPPPPAGADDAAIKAYALAVMPELFDQWRDAEVGTTRDADFTLRAGRRAGRPFFETREAWRDGCEPYDGYTQVVIDRDLLFVTRALVAPAASTNPWLQPFFDVPFQHRTQLARRRGPETGPC